MILVMADCQSSNGRGPDSQVPSKVPNLINTNSRGWQLVEEAQRRFPLAHSVSSSVPLTPIRRKTPNKRKHEIAVHAISPKFRRVLDFEGKNLPLGSNVYSKDPEIFTSEFIIYLYY